MVYCHGAPYGTLVRHVWFRVDPPPSKLRNNVTERRNSFQSNPAKTYLYFITKDKHRLIPPPLADGESGSPGGVASVFCSGYLASSRCGCSSALKGVHFEVYGGEYVKALTVSSEVDIVYGTLANFVVALLC